MAIQAGRFEKTFQTPGKIVTLPRWCGSGSGDDGVTEIGRGQVSGIDPEFRPKVTLALLGRGYGRPQQSVEVFGDCSGIHSLALLPAPR
jgi:hypothetical protein